jgi:hypothetical protein
VVGASLTGACEGKRVGDWLGERLGNEVRGEVLGLRVGDSDGDAEGNCELGEVLGRREGDSVGDLVGEREGLVETGPRVGLREGNEDHGALLGDALTGAFDGERDGDVLGRELLGASLGLLDGRSEEGDKLGEVLGRELLGESLGLLEGRSEEGEVLGRALFGDSLGLFEGRSGACEGLATVSLLGAWLGDAVGLAELGAVGVADGAVPLTQRQTMGNDAVPLSTSFENKVVALSTPMPPYSKLPSMSALVQYEEFSRIDILFCKALKRSDGVRMAFCPHVRNGEQEAKLKGAKTGTTSAHTRGRVGALMHARSACAYVMSGPTTGAVAYAHRGIGGSGAYGPGVTMVRIMHTAAAGLASRIARISICFL